MKWSAFLLAILYMFAANISAEVTVLKDGIGSLPAMEQPPVRSPGYIFKGLKDGEAYSSKLVSRSAGMENWKNSEGCEWTRSEKSFFAPATSWADCDGNTGTAKVTEKNSAWPLKLGHEWSYSVDGGDWETDRNCEVTDTIRVRSMLGEHDAYKVVCRDNWNTRTWYISTKLERVVYYQHRPRRSGGYVIEPTQ